MKLERIEIKNYRSLFVDNANNHFSIDLAEGMNAIVGQNNCGKSNVFRALALALDEHFTFDRKADMPSVANGPLKPVVTLTFRVPEHRRPQTEKTLLKYLDEYERALNPHLTSTWASKGKFKLRVTIEVGPDAAGARRSVFVVQGVGARSLPDNDPRAEKALTQFKKCLHFVLIRSGQGLESLLEGKFRDVLRTVLRENESTQYALAEQSRQRYLEGLQNELLRPLTERISGELNEMFPEIDSVTLRPSVAELEESLTRMRVDVGDAAVTDLAEKGTGVRGALIVAILRHLAETGRRSMLFAVEEPEAFLHPAAQESLREDLEALAVRDNVSLLVASHSPYVVSRSPGARVISLDKDRSGRTIVSGSADGGGSYAGAFEGLYRSATASAFLDRASSIPESAAMVVVVEGRTDQEYMELAARCSGRPDLIEDIAFVQAGDGIEGKSPGGADLAVLQALLMQAYTVLPVVVVLDDDEPGRKARDALKRIAGKTNRWNKHNLLGYQRAFPFNLNGFAIEAEDLWPDALAESFIGEHGEDVLNHKLRRPSVLGGFQYDLRPEMKGEYCEHLRRVVRRSDCAKWIEFLELIRSGALAARKANTTTAMP